MCVYRKAETVYDISLSQKLHANLQASECILFVVNGQLLLTFCVFPAGLLTQQAQVG